MCYFFKRTCCNLLLTKITCHAKGKKKIACCEEKSQPSPLISNGPSLKSRKSSNCHCELDLYTDLCRILPDFEFVKRLNKNEKM